MNVLLLLYSVLGENLGLAIIVLTILLRIILFPFMKSQMESSAKLRKIQPMMQSIQKKYAKNPKKAQEEQLKLYRQVGYNPLGCLLSMLLPFPFLIAIYQAIRAFSGGDGIPGIYEWVRTLLDLSGDVMVSTMFLGFDLSDAYLPIARASGYLALAALPYLVLSVLTGVSQYFSVKFTQDLMGAPKPEEKKPKKDAKAGDQPDMSEMMNQMGKSMTFTFPLMSVFIAVSLPAAVSLYWILQSWVPVAMYQLYNKFIRKP
ncbi:MAG: YidC/Oxa1 family membrane protein insertase [Candidatus Dojkabacteria bacterium]|nr:YidC/Oxa1 family membrane protein insertase [Candidatus Dojkabacteria bacterium]